jgi:hypothetical protein
MQDSREAKHPGFSCSYGLNFFCFQDLGLILMFLGIHTLA